MLKQSIRLCIFMSGVFFCQDAFASRIMSADIWLPGERVVLTANASDDGKASDDEVWANIKDLYFGGEGVGIVSDPKNPLQATLEGKMKVTITDHGAVKIDRIRLIRESRAVFKWKIHPDDVAEMGKIRKKRE